MKTWEFCLLEFFFHNILNPTSFPSYRHYNTLTWSQNARNPFLQDLNFKNIIPVDPPEWECLQQFVSRIPFSKILYSKSAKTISSSRLLCQLKSESTKFISKQGILTWREELTESEKRMEEKEKWFCFSLLLLEPIAMQTKIWQITGFEYKINKYDRISSNLHVPVSNNEVLHDEVFLVFQLHPSEMLVWAEIKTQNGTFSKL